MPAATVKTSPFAPPRPQPSALLQSVPLLLIFTLAIWLRLWGIGWGLPNAARLFSYHPDESMVAGASLVLNPFAFQFDPGFYNYGSLALLLNSLAIHLGEYGGIVAPGPAAGVPSATALLTARLVTALLGTATCGFLYGTGRRLYGAAAGIAAGIVYAVAPLAVQHGHFATVDVPATFFIAGALYFAARHLQPTSCRPRDLLWCGLWAGFAAATKYNAGIVILAGVAAWRLTEDRPAKALLVLLGAAILGFFVGCPAALLNPQGTLAAIAYESLHAREGHGSVFAGTPPAFWYHVSLNLRWGLGWPLLLVSGAGIGYALYRRRPGDLLLLAFAVPFYALIGLAQIKFARYTLPLFPPLALLVGGLIPWPVADMPSRRRMGLVSGALGAAAAFALLLSLGFDSVMGRTDPRDQAAAFIRERGIQSVGFATGPWFYSPPLSPLLGSPNPQAAKASASRFDVVPRLIAADGEWNREQLRQTDPDAVVLSEINEYADAERAHLPAAVEYLAVVQRIYPRQTVFANPVQVFGLPFTNLSTARGLPTQNLPHDMLYTNPTTILYTK
ncbi:MAG: glycosyltransferase family 39 protein [Cytophagales bacterium]|nr:glycosyltransferase family 39 protein [Armatimonadota bacterium]